MMSVLVYGDSQSWGRQPCFPMADAAAPSPIDGIHLDAAGRAPGEAMASLAARPLDLPTG